MIIKKWIFTSGVRKITLQLAKELKTKNMLVVPGWLFCKRCCCIANKEFSQFFPVNEQKIYFKSISTDTNVLGSFTFQPCNQESFRYEMLDSVSCIYDNLWWIGMIVDIDELEMDCELKFLHPPGPTTIFIGLQEMTFVGFLLILFWTRFLHPKSKTEKITYSKIVI